jgi:type IV pilus assembly protein PilB
MPAQRNVIVSQLLAKNILTPEEVQQAESKANTEQRPILKVLVEDRYVGESDVYRIVADSTNMPFIEVEEMQIDPSASGRLPGDWARKLHALPFAWEENTLLVAVDDPTSLTLRDDLGRLTGVPLQLHLAPPTNLMNKINQTYRAESEMDDLSDAITTDDFSEMDDSSLGGTSENDAPIVKYVNLLISQAISDRASDVHIEPTETDLQVRYRIDGVLHKQMTSSRSILNGVVSRIKIMANMDIAERRIPQDGRMSANIQGRKVDLRVATIPTVYGEKVVLRILDNTSTPLDLLDTGFSVRHNEIFKKQYVKPHGMILVTGPTGSGKSTTLYSTLHAITNPAINIITVEDPVEYRMNGISQMQINVKAGLTFASALRSILRADPDVVLVGEIRDKETAQIAIEAALTGHLVLSTLHTNDAPSATTRLIEMGVEPFLVGSAVTTIVAQRLVRKLCDRCKVPYQLEKEEIERLEWPWEEGDELPTVYRPVGCSYCSKLGYRGRMAIHEVLVVTDRVERLINEGAHTDQVRNLAVEEGMEVMRFDGWAKVAQGHTSIEEVLRVVG